MGAVELINRTFIRDMQMLRYFLLLICINNGIYCPVTLYNCNFLITENNIKLFTALITCVWIRNVHTQVFTINHLTPFRNLPWPQKAYKKELKAFLSVYRGVGTNITQSLRPLIRTWNPDLIAPSYYMKGINPKLVPIKAFSRLD